MTDERREELRRFGLGPIPGPCGCVFYGSERDEKDCREGHVRYVSKPQPFVYTDVDENGFIVERGHPGEGMRLIDCQGYRPGIDCSRITVLTTAIPPEAEKHTCEWLEEGGAKFCGKPAVEWTRFLRLREWATVCQHHGGSSNIESNPPKPLPFGVYRKTEGRTGVGELYQFLMLARHHTSGDHFVVYIPLRVEPEWSGTIRPCILERAKFERKFAFVGEGLP